MQFNFLGAILISFVSSTIVIASAQPLPPQSVVGTFTYEYLPKR